MWNMDRTEPIRSLTIEKESSKVQEFYITLEQPNTLSKTHFFVSFV